MYGLRQTGPFLDFEAASKPLEPLHALPLARLLALSCDELGYFVSTYTHMICYGAMVLSHALLSTPASAVAVFFVLAMAALQEPYPARWHWKVIMMYLALVSSGKAIASFLAARMCGTVWAADTWVCAAMLPAWSMFAGKDGSNLRDMCVVDFAALLVLVAHRANMQYRGLWLDVGPKELVPPPHILAQVQQSMRQTAADTAGSDDEAEAVAAAAAGERGEEAQDNAGSAHEMPSRTPSPGKRFRQSLRAGQGIGSPCAALSPRSAARSSASAGALPSAALFPLATAGHLSSVSTLSPLSSSSSRASRAYASPGTPSGGGGGGGGRPVLRQRRGGAGGSGSVLALAASPLRDSVTHARLNSPVPRARRQASWDDEVQLQEASVLEAAAPASKGALGVRAVRSVGVVEGWGWGAWRWWLQKHKLVWIETDADVHHADVHHPSSSSGTGVDLYLWVVMPELLSLVCMFGALLSSGSDSTASTNKLQTLASGSVVDWQTLGWVFLAFFQFLTIVLDRVLYLRRSIFAKAVLQLASLVLFFALFFFDLRAPVLAISPAFVLILFLLKCCYWIFSARQIRLGYPSLHGGVSQSANYFFRDFSFSGYCAYMLYLGTPFLPDMRCMLDWTCTPTTLDFFQWLTLESIYSVLYQRQVTLAYRRRYGRGFGAPQPWMIKWSTGVSFFSALAIVIWGPLLVSVVSAKYSQPRSAPVVAVKMEVSLATSAGDQFFLSSLASFAKAHLHLPDDCSMSSNNTRFANLANATWWLPADAQARALELLHKECTLKDAISEVYMSSEQDMWAPTPHRRRSLSAALASAYVAAETAEEEGRVPSISNASEAAVWLDVLVYFTRNTTGLNTVNDDTQYQSTVIQVHQSSALPRDAILQLQDMLERRGGSLVIPSVVAPLVKLSSDAATPLYAAHETLQSVNLTLSSAGMSMWWAVCCDAATHYCQDSAANPVLKDGGDGCAGIWFLTSSEPVGGGVFSRFGLSLITIYTIFVLYIGKTVRASISGLINHVIYNELPSTSKLWALCNDIYTARYHKDLWMEEELFAMLVDIYRSPETLLKLSGEQSRDISASRLFE